LDGVEACTRRLKVLKAQLGGLRKVHLRDCLIKAQEDGDKAKSQGILCTIKREEQKSIWRRIDQAINEPSLGVIPLVQNMEDGEVINITETEEMNKEIQEVTEKRFDLSMSALLLQCPHSAKNLVSYPTLILPSAFFTAMFIYLMTLTM
jgi:hypothetical protein